MNRRTFLVGGVSVAAGGSALLGSGALSEAETNRDVTIEVVGDEDAYLRLVYESQTVDCDETITLVELTNHLRERLTAIEFTYDVEGDNVTVSELDVPDSLDVGDSGDVTARVECDESTETTVSLTFDVSVSNDDIDASAQDREIEITCECSGSDDNPSDDHPGDPPGDDHPGDPPGDDHPGDPPGDDHPGGSTGDDSSGNSAGDDTQGDQSDGEGSASPPDDDPEL